MNLQSLSLRTELMLRSFESEIAEKPDYIVIRTPRNPTFRWGNYLVFREPPKPGDLERWKAIFAQEVGTPPAINHFVFTWDTTGGEQGAAKEFVEAGFRLEESVVLTARSVNPPPKRNTECELRAFERDRDWEEWLELALAQNAAEPPESREGAGYKDFLQKKISERKRMIAAGWGQWFGAYLGGRLGATMGLFVRGGLGRFQSVDTHPEFRRRGLAGTLLYHVAQKGFAEMSAEDLVIVADQNYFAKDIYASVGFRPTERTVAVEWSSRYM
jgi:ribosomal protein S18 acetylase RimI-like enzyme